MSASYTQRVEKNIETRGPMQARDFQIASLLNRPVGGRVYYHQRRHRSLGVRTHSVPGLTRDIINQL